MTTQRVALVTGAAKGIGLAVAHRLAADGYALVLTDIDVAEATARAAELPRAVAVEHDVRDPAHAAAVVAVALEEFGTIDVLVNNAGLNIVSKPTAEVTDADLDLVFGVNLFGALYVTRAVIPVMQKAGSGSIVNLSSVLGLKPAPYVSTYVASKYAITGYTNSLAVELAKDGITVNSVHPGIVDTNLHTKVTEGVSALRGITFDEATEFFLSGIPLHRYQTVNDVAAMVSFLVSDGARNITGSNFKVDGGMGLA
jgi:NAD(P)-dependent dehydrogenase (short-subunit alcohol dehydrogenase family)